MKKWIFCLCIAACCSQTSVAQDTFSIVAIDSITGEVGSAGASCLDLFTIPGFDDDQIGDIIPGKGAINTQASYLLSNQNSARNRFNSGMTPVQVIDWLVANDVQNNPGIRQYGIVGFVNGVPQSAAFTGDNCLDWKGHRTGANYSIQGNILLGPQVLDSMEARFLAAEGDLACKLMAAMQGAKMVGADSRCTTNGTSSLFAFLKVAQPTDSYFNPSFFVSVRTHGTDGVEPIDTLQTLFDAAHPSCAVSATHIPEQNAVLSIFPNPATNGPVTIQSGIAVGATATYTITDLLGNIIVQGAFQDKMSVDTRNWQNGMYFVLLRDGFKQYSTKLYKLE